MVGGTTNGGSTGLASLRELSRILRRERDTLGLFLDRAASDDADLGECSDILRSLGGVELHRAITAREAARELGVSADATLRVLADGAPAPWPAVLGAHRGALLALAAAVAAVRRCDPIDLREAPSSVAFEIPRSLAEFLS